MKSAFFIRMFPKETPIKLLIEHAAILEEISRLIKPLIESWFQNKDIYEEMRFISKRESDADEIKFQIRKMLSQSVRTPFAVKDILDYLHLQDSLIDRFEDVAKKLSLNKVEGLDDYIKEKVMELTDQVIQSIDYLEDMIREVRKVITYSFPSKLLKKEANSYVKIEDIENKVDDISIEIGKWIYSKKKEINPVDLIFFREMVLILVHITDRAENTAELLNAFLK
ncbi:MAG TPA: DUF47 family protein [Firmicutes bacterium]|nr:DUF47 family protein [Bacillota bacterium]